MDYRQRAVRYLSIRPRSQKEMADYLRGKGCPAEEAEAILCELQEYHYLDDLEFARMYAEAGFEKGRGKQRILRELAAKGISREMAEEAMELLEDIPDEHQVALQIAREILRGVDLESMDRKEKEKIKARVARRLASRGFETGIIYRVIRESEEEQ